MRRSTEISSSPTARTSLPTCEGDEESDRPTTIPRRKAEAACKAGAWGECADWLNDARHVDSAGDEAPEVKAR